MSSSSSFSPPARTRAIRTPYHKWRAHHITWMTDGHTRFGNWDTVTQYMNNKARKAGEPQAFNTPMVKAYYRFLRKKGEREAEEATMRDEDEEDYEEEDEDEVGHGDVEVEKFAKEAVVGMREEARAKRGKATQEKSGGERADIMKVKSILQDVEPKEPGRVKCVEYKDGMAWRKGLKYNCALVSKDAFDAAQGLLKMSKSAM